MYQLYDFNDSGNGYKVALLLTQCNRPYTYHECNITKGATHTEEFLKMNPTGKIPVLLTPEGHTLNESNAILTYLAKGTSFLPDEELAHYHVMRWLFWEQSSHEPNIATSRFLLHHGDPDTSPQKLQERRPGCLKALTQMEDHLAASNFLVGDAYTIADIALYAYTHVADEGGYPLDNYPAIRAWLKRVQGQPNHITLADKAG